MIQFCRVKSWSSVVAITMVTWFISANAAALERYVRAELVSDSQLKITLSDGRSRLIARDAAGTQFDEPQVGFKKPEVSPDGTRVGWLALYPNSDATYPIPITLVIYKNGRIEARLDGDGQPTWNCLSTLRERKWFSASAPPMAISLATTADRRSDAPGPMRRSNGRRAATR